MFSISSLSTSIPFTWVNFYLPPSLPEWTSQSYPHFSFRQVLIYYHSMPKQSLVHREESANSGDWFIMYIEAPNQSYYLLFSTFYVKNYIEAFCFLLLSAWDQYHSFPRLKPLLCFSVKHFFSDCHTFCPWRCSYWSLTQSVALYNSAAHPKQNVFLGCLSILTQISRQNWQYWYLKYRLPKTEE